MVSTPGWETPVFPKNWECLTQDQFILQIVSGVLIPFREIIPFKETASSPHSYPVRNGKNRSGNCGNAAKRSASGGLPKEFKIKIDLKDVYFSVPMSKQHQRFLMFTWSGGLYQFTCLPFGLEPVLDASSVPLASLRMTYYANAVEFHGVSGICDKFSKNVIGSRWQKQK